MTGPTLCPMFRTWLADTPSSLSMEGMRSHTRPIVSGPCPPEMPASALSQVCKGQMVHTFLLIGWFERWTYKSRSYIFFYFEEAAILLYWHKIHCPLYITGVIVILHDISYDFLCCYLLLLLTTNTMSCRLTLKVVVSLKCFVVYFSFHFNI